MLINVELNVSRQKRLSFRDADSIGHFHFEWHSPNKIGNIGILALWRDREKLLAPNGFGRGHNLS